MEKLQSVSAGKLILLPVAAGTALLRDGDGILGLVGGVWHIDDRGEHGCMCIAPFDDTLAYQVCLIVELALCERGMCNCGRGRACAVPHTRCHSEQPALLCRQRAERGKQRDEDDDEGAGEGQQQHADQLVEKVELDGDHAAERRDAKDLQGGSGR